MIRPRRIVTLLASLFLTVSMSAIAPAIVFAQGATSQINGTVASEDGLGVGGATVSVYRGGAVIAQTTTNGDGQYTFAGLSPGEYSIVVRATGYTSTRIEAVAVVSGSPTVVRTPLRRAQTTNTNGPAEIGRTSAVGRATALASTATIQYNLEPDQIQNQGFLKAGDAIGQVPGVNLTGGPHTVGDDTFVDIRGLGAGEVRPLVDGHPIGPLGVYSTDTYNYNNTAYALLDNINVTIGSGATGLYGVDVIGGTIDFQTLSPTGRPHAAVLQSYGNDGTAETLFKSTGTIGRLGYAFGHSVTGTYGSLAPGAVFQSARPNANLNLPNGGACTAGNDVSSCNQALNTYTVSGNYKVLNDLLKLRYSVTPSTAVTLTAYDGNTHADSTGNGDNDYVPYATRLAVLGAATPNCPVGFLVATDNSPHGNGCYTAQQYAAASSGPFGGGEDRNRGTTVQDFSGRITTQFGINALSLSAFSDYYNFHKFSAGASGLDPTGTFVVGGGTYQDDYLTHGILVTDDIATASNDLGFGYFVEHQKTYGDNRLYDSNANTVTFVENPILGEGDYSFFIRDNFTPTSKLSIFTNAWDRRSSATQKTTLDPRVSVLYRATRSDIVRLTAGQADGDPSVNITNPYLLSGIGNPSSLNPSCSQLNNVASAGNPALKPERSSDLEAAYGHRFWSDTSVNVVAYVSSVRDQIITGGFPITAQALQNPIIAAELAGYAQKINGACPGADYSAATVGSILGVSEYFNSTSALFRGVEATGRVRITPQFRLDATYDIQSSQQFGVPVAFLKANPFALDGGQIYGIPLHKFNVGADYTSRKGFEAQLQLYYIGNNNTLNRPAYTYYNGFISKTIGRNASLTLSAYNVFNQNAQNYGYFGEQLPAPENQYQTNNATAIGQAVGLGLGTQEELFGLQPRLITLQFSAHI